MPKKRCFVISPIGIEGSEVREDADDVFELIIKPATEECDVEVYRSDQLNEPGRITDQMFNSILHEDFCIAVLTDYNPNVFYELAVAQSAGKPVIILMKKGDDLPFDIKDLRCIFYDLKPRSFTRGTYKAELASHIRKLASQGWTAESILTRYSNSKTRSISSIRNDVCIRYFLRGIKEHYFRRLTEMSKPARISVRLNIMAPDDATEEKTVRLRIATADYLSDYDDLEKHERWYEGQGKCGAAWEKATLQVFAEDINSPETSFQEMGHKSQPAQELKSVLSAPILWNERPIAILNMDSFHGGNRTLLNTDAVKSIFTDGARDIVSLLIKRY